MFKRMLMTFIVAILAASEAQATPIVFRAVLDGASESPPVPTPGVGSTDVIYDDVAHTLLVNVTFTGLTGTTTAAHIHCCTDAPNNVGVATQVPTFAGFPLGVTAGAYSRLFDLTLDSSWNPAFINNNGGTPASAEAVLADGLAAERAYLNIHSTFRPGGEIRGFLQHVPEPATWSLLGVGMLLLARQKQRLSQG